MLLPHFTESGDLPPGVHSATLSEVLKRFGNISPKRKILAQRLERIYGLASTTDKIARFVVFGSFITSKLEPNDVDVFILMDNSFNISQLSGESRLLFEHGTAQDYFGCSVFWMRRIAALDGEESTIGHWQIKRDGSNRGIVEIISE